MLSAALLISVAAALITCVSAAPTCDPTALITCVSAAPICPPTALPTCSLADLLSYLNSITGVANATKVVDAVLKASGVSGASGVFWGSVFAGLMAIVAINSGLPKPDKNCNEKQVNLLLKFHRSAARLHYINAGIVVLTFFLLPVARGEAQALAAVMAVWVLEVLWCIMAVNIALFGYENWQFEKVTVPPPVVPPLENPQDTSGEGGRGRGL